MSGRPSKTGHRGVWRHACGKWAAQIYRDGATYHLGLFEKIEDAIAAVARAERGKMPRPRGYRRLC